MLTSLQPLLLLLALLVAQTCLRAQTSPPAPEKPADPPSTYALGPDDQIAIRALDADELSTTSTPLRIDARGNITLPMVGRIHAAGLTTDELAQVIEDKLKRYLQAPDVTVYLVEMRSQPVSILGAVGTPGVHQLQGHKTLFEVISLAGGIRQDAGYQINIARHTEWGRIPLPTAKDDPTGRFSVASIGIKSVMDASDPTQNIEIKPEDVITVPKGEVVYAIGAVQRPGGFVLGEHEGISVLQVLSLAEGLARFADTKKAKIMRPLPHSDTRAEIPVNLKQVMAGKGDIQMQANDVLFVPTSGKKAATVRTMEAAIGAGTTVGTGIAVYRH